MRNVPQYASHAVSMSVEKVSIAKLHFLTQHVRGYKLRQIGALTDLYTESGIDLFVPTKITYKDNRHTLVGIPVVEEIHGTLYVIEGNTRLYHCEKNQMLEAYVLVVRNVAAPLPSDGDYRIQQMLLTDGDRKGAMRYASFKYDHFRPVERSVRDPNSCLK